MSEKVTWAGSLAPLGVDSIDHRRLLPLTGDADVRTTGLPLRLLWQIPRGEPGDTRPVGTIDSVEINEHDWLQATGTFDDTEDGRGAAIHVRNGHGLIDLELTDVTEETDDTNPNEPVKVLTDWVISGAIIVPDAKFNHGAEIALTGSARP
jgi:hypothetical protein